MRLYRLQLVQTPVQLLERFHGQSAVRFIYCRIENPLRTCLQLQRNSTKGKSSAEIETTLTRRRMENQTDVKSNKQLRFTTDYA